MEKRYSLRDPDHMRLLDMCHAALRDVEIEESRYRETVTGMQVRHEGDLTELLSLKILVADLWSLLCEMQEDGTHASVDTMASLEERVAPYLKLEAR